MALEKVSSSVKETIEKARSAEIEKDYPAAAALYEHAIQIDPIQEKAYDRLMIVYRKQKDYKNELRIIKAGIKAYQNFYKSQTPTGSKKVADLSKKLSRSFGLTDKTGDALYEPEPIPQWKKRKEVVEKRLNKKSKK